MRIDEEKLALLDDAVAWGEKYGLHINIAMHRLPGYCVNPDEEHEETMDLWTQAEAREAAVLHWTTIGKRYKDISSDKLSFNIVNEPMHTVTPEQYRVVANSVIKAVRETTPNRLFLIDGLHCGELPPVDQFMKMENCGFSCHAYAPQGLTHYCASNQPFYENHPPQWPGAMRFEEDGEITVWDGARLKRLYSLWTAWAEATGSGVHCGEWGCYCKTPHDVTLRWMEEVLDILKSCNIGWALWNLHGTFGVMDSHREDVDYTNCAGFLLDKKMMQLLQKY